MANDMEKVNSSGTMARPFRANGKWAPKMAMECGKLLKATTTKVNG